MYSILEGVPLYAYGHSYLASLSNRVSAGQRYINRTADRLRMSLMNRAVSGSEMLDAAMDMLYGPTAWSPGATGVVVLDCTTNTLKNWGEDAQAMRGYKWSLRSALRYLSLSSAVPDDAGSLKLSGDGEQTDSDDYTGGTLWRMTKGQNGNVSFNFNFKSNNLVIGFGGRSDSIGGEFELLADGAIVSSWDTDNVCRPSMKTGRTYCPFVADPILPDGSHTMLIRPTGGLPATGGLPYLDYVGTISKTPPMIVVIKALNVPDWSLWPGGATADTVAKYNAIIDAEVAEHRKHATNVLICDPTDGWNPKLHVGSDGLHPSARGHAHIADKLTSLLTVANVDFTLGVTR